MKKIQQDLDVILSLEDKKRLLQEIGHDDLLVLFTEKYKPQYKPAVQKRSPLDQMVAISITGKEKDKLREELAEIKRLGTPQSISKFIRSRAVAEIDIGGWAERAIAGLKAFEGSDWNKQILERDRRRIIKILENGDPEEEHFANKQLTVIDNKLKELNRKAPRRSFRLTGRVTFNEANHIRWRAARLSLSVADYIRFVVFGYLPFTESDGHLTIEARKRFYVSIIDVARNGWGLQPEVESCPNCLRYQAEIKELKEQLSRYSTLIREHNINRG